MDATLRARPACSLSALGLAVATLCLILMLVAPPPAGGMQRRAGLEELARRAQSIVVATTVAQHCRWVGDLGRPHEFRGLIVTDVRLRVCRVLKGAVHEAVTVTVPGGTVDDLSLRPPDAASFSKGATYVVFLNGSGGVLGWRQGNPAVVGGRVLGMGCTLAGLERRVAALVGAAAVALRPLPPIARRPVTLRTGEAGIGAGTTLHPADAATDASTTLGGVPPTRVADLTVPLNVAVAWAAQDEAARSAEADRATVGEAGSGATIDASGVAREPAPRVSPRQPTQLWSNGFEGAGAVKPYNQAGATWWTAVGGGMAPYNWAQTTVRRSEGSTAAYCCNGSGVAAPGPYRDNMAAWMWTASTIDLSGYTQGTLYFDYYMNSQNGPDGLWVMVNKGDDNSKGLFWSGDYQGFFNRGLLNLTNVPGLGNVCGCSTVRIAFCFVSDASVTAEGAYVDNVRMVCGTGPGITSVTPAMAPAGTGTAVTVSGFGFGAAPGAVEFFYRDGEPLIRGAVSSWTDSAVVCTVPVGIINDYAASAGSGPVHVLDAAGTQSNEDAFYATFSADGLRWPTSRAHYRVNAPSDAALAAVRAAADQWNAAGSPFRFVYDGRCRTSSHTEYDSHNDIFWASLGDPMTNGCAWPFYRKNRLVECDICMNTDMAWGDGSSGTLDIQTIALHELGHWLNLRDLYGDWDAHKAMYGYCDPGIVKKAPSTSDVDGIKWLYAAAKPDTKRPRTIAYRSFGRTGGRMKIYFRIKDPAPSIGWASGRIIIRDSRGRLVGRLVMRDPRVETNRLGYWIERRCPLPRGTYRFWVYAKDIDGHKQSKVGSNLLIMR